MRIGRFLTVTEVHNYIVDYHQPALFIARNDQSIPNNVVTPISFNDEAYDELGMWNIADPTNIYVPSDAIWTVSIYVALATNTTGFREVYLGGYHLPAMSCWYLATGTHPHSMSKTVVVHISDSAPISLSIYQNSGGALTVQTAQLMMLRHVEVAYP